MASSATPEASPEPGWREIPCPFRLPSPEREGDTYVCGTIQVPLDHTNPSGPSIELTFARLFATGPETDADPVLWLEGGPGASALAVAATNRLIAASVRTTHDVILFDQRGAGYSGYLECGSYQSAATTGSIAEGTPFPETPAPDAGVAEVFDYARATAALGFEACRDGYAEEGLDLRFFTTEAIAQDSLLLLDALGYSQATLWGTSYGGRIATVIMRDFPERVRAAVLDSPLPLGIRRLETFATLETEPAGNLFAWCTADDACRATYPDLQERALALIAALDADPIPLDPEVAFRSGLTDEFSGAGVVRLLTAVLSGNPDAAGAIPRAIVDLESGDATLALAMLSGGLDTPERDIPPTLTETSFAPLLQATDARLALSLAMRTAVLCNDEAGVTLADLAREEANGPVSPLRGVVPFRSAITLYAQCRAIDTGAEPLDRTGPTTSIPVLVLGGSYDGTTAPSWAEQAANALPNAHFVLVPGAGHATARWSSCARELISGFIGEPTEAIDQSCLADEHPALLLPDSPLPIKELAR